MTRRDESLGVSSHDDRCVEGFGKGNECIACVLGPTAGDDHERLGGVQDFRRTRKNLIRGCRHLGRDLDADELLTLGLEDVHGDREVNRSWT